MILVEEGPWSSGTEEACLRALQARLYDYVDVAIDGHLGQRYPDSKGASVQIRVDGYELPHDLVRDFVDRFAHHIAQDPERAPLIAPDKHVASLTFRYAACSA